MQDTTLTPTERQEIANAYIARAEAEALETQKGKDYDVFYACTSGSYKGLLQYLICVSPEAAALVKKTFLK